MANDFTIEISADDAASAIIQKVNASLEKLTGKTQMVGKQTKSVSEQSRAGLGKLEESFKKVERSASLVVDKIVEIIPGLAAIGGMTAIGAISEKFASFGQKLTTNARLVGMNTRELLKFEYAAKRAGQSSESIVSTLGSMQDAIRGAAMGQNPQAMAQLSGWGINLKRNPDGSVANMNDVVLQVMDKINQVHSAPAQRYAAGLFGATGSLPMIQQGTYRADMERADKPGFLPTDEEIAKGEALKKQLTDLGQAFDTLTVKMGAAMEPIVGPILDSLTKFLNSDTGRVAAEMAAAFAAMISVISTLKIVTATGRLLGFGGKLDSVAGSAETAATGLGKVSTALSSIGGLALLGFAGYAAESGRAGALDSSIHQVAGETKDQRDQRVADAIAGGGIVSPMTGPSKAGPWTKWNGFWNNLFGSSSASAKAQASAHAPATAANAASGTLPLGIRSNNPLNVSPGGQEAIYASAEDGIAAATANLRSHYRGLSLAQIADKWTGGARMGNTAIQRANYLALLTQGTGLDANAVPDLNNQQLVAAMLTRQIQAENGTNGGKAWYSPDQVAAGVARGFGGSPAMTGTTAGSSSPTDIRVTFDNVPKGTKVEAKTADGAWMPTRINYSLTN